MGDEKAPPRGVRTEEGMQERFIRKILKLAIIFSFFTHSTSVLFTLLIFTCSHSFIEFTKFLPTLTDPEQLLNQRSKYER